MAEPHDAVPIEPPATGACGRPEWPISTRTRPGSTPSAAAAICVRTVRAPVPISVAATRTVNVPSASRRAVACDGLRRAG